MLRKLQKNSMGARVGPRGSGGTPVSACEELEPVVGGIQVR